MDARRVGACLVLSFLVGCGTGRTEQVVDGSVAAASSESGACAVEVYNPTYRTLSLSQAVKGVRGSTPVGVVERRSHFRFNAPCARGTVYLYGYSDGFREGELVAEGRARLAEGRVVTLELERRLF